MITLNPKFEARADYSGEAAPSGAGHANYIELIDCILIHFNKLRKLYENLT